LNYVELTKIGSSKILIVYLDLNAAGSSLREIDQTCDLSAISSAIGNCGADVIQIRC
jgi:hypothetical protein